MYSKFSIIANIFNFCSLKPTIPASRYRSRPFCLIFLHTTLHFVANRIVLTDAKKYDALTKINVNHKQVLAALSLVRCAHPFYLVLLTHNTKR